MKKAMIITLSVISLGSMLFAAATNNSLRKAEAIVKRSGGTKRKSAGKASKMAVNENGSLAIQEREAGVKADRQLSNGGRLKKDGTPDLRYKQNK